MPLELQLIEDLHAAGQGHLVAHAAALSISQRTAFAAQLASVNCGVLSELNQPEVETTAGGSGSDQNRNRGRPQSNTCSATEASTMSWMITDRSELCGTCYIEVLPGKYEKKCWNPETVYFKEEHFGFIEPTIVRHCPEHDRYAFTNISRSKWQDIVADLERVANSIDESTRLLDIEGEVEQFFTTTRQQFLQSEAEKVGKLRSMLIEFIAWVRNVLESHDAIAVLGM